MTPEERKQFNEMFEYFERHKNQQIHSPLDETSKAVIYENVPTVVRWVSGSGSNNGYLRVRINGKSYKIMTRA